MPSSDWTRWIIDRHDDTDPMADPEPFLESEAISDWEEGFIRGFEAASAA